MGSWGSVVPDFPRRLVSTKKVRYNFSAFDFKLLQSERLWVLVVLVTATRLAHAHMDPSGETTSKSSLIIEDPLATLSDWLDSAGLGRVPGLRDALIKAAPLGLDELKSMRDDEVAAVIAPLNYKPGSITCKKLQSAVRQLRSDGAGRRAQFELESSITGDASSLISMPPPPRPTFGNFLKVISSADHSLGGILDLGWHRRHSAPPAPSAALCVDSNAEAAELVDLASLFRSGEHVSVRADADAAGRAQAKAADLRANQRAAPARTPPTAFRSRSRLSRRSSPSAAAGGSLTADEASSSADDEATGGDATEEGLGPVRSQAAFAAQTPATLAKGTKVKKVKKGTKGSKSERGTRATSGKKSARAPSTARAGSNKRGGGAPSARKKKENGGGDVRLPHSPCMAPCYCSPPRCVCTSRRCV